MIPARAAELAQIEAWIAEHGIKRLASQPAEALSAESLMHALRVERKRKQQAEIRTRQARSATAAKKRGEA